MRTWRAVRACEPFGGLPVRSGEHLVMIRAAQLSSGGGCPGEGWSLIHRWLEPHPCALMGRLEAALCAHNLTSLEALDALDFSLWLRPEGAPLTPLNEEERALFTFE